MKVHPSSSTILWLSKTLLFGKETQRGHVAKSLAKGGIFKSGLKGTKSHRRRYATTWKPLNSTLENAKIYIALKVEDNEGSVGESW